MARKTLITVTQLFGMLFVSRMVVNITYNPFMASDGEIWDHMLSAVGAFLLTFVLVIPVYLLYRRYPRMSITEDAYYLMGKAAFLVVGVYALYFLLVSCYTLSLFNVFVTNVMSPKVSLVVLSIAVTATACYGAFKGIEALARTSGLVLIGICAALVFLVCALAPRMEMDNFPPLMYNGPKSTVNGVLLMLSRTSSVPVLAMLLPFAKGNAKKGIAVWNTVTYLSIAGLITVMVGALGDFLKTQIFPIYAATSIAEIGIFKRMDALFLGIWTMGLFIKLALFLLLFSMCVAHMLGRKAGRISILVGGALVAAAGVWVADSRELARSIYDLRFLLVATLLTSIVLPVLLLIVDSIKKRRKGNKRETEA